ncbi:MAG: hypothetical protein JNK38_02325 [Acidobacteria bacterium]|nr:hypothetical protein [Acidobacteriota bacterium]
MKSDSRDLFAVRFSDMLRKLKKRENVDDRDLFEKLKGYINDKGKKGITRGAISQIASGKARPSSGLVKELARILNEPEEKLLCVAGYPPSTVRDLLSENPELYYVLIGKDSNIIRIGVAEILWAAPIFAVPHLNYDEKVNTQFECKLYETGQEAIKALLDGQVQFATVTRAAIEKLKGHKGTAEIYYVLDFFTSRSGSLYSLYKLRNAKQHKAFAYISGSVMEDVAKEYMKKNDQISVIGASGVTEISERIIRNEIQGFFGWPPLDDKVTREIKARLEIDGTTPGQIAKASSFAQEDIPMLSDLIPSLYLVSTNNVISDIGAAKLTDLVSRILDAREQLNGAPNRRDFIASILSNYMDYLSDKTKDKLKMAVFDANIEADAFKFMIAERGHWATTSQWLR